MKKIVDFFKVRNKELALFALIVITSALSGINLGLLLLIILFFGGLGVIGKSSPEKLLHILEVVIFIISIGSYTVARFPRSNSKIPYARAAIDQKVSSVMPDKTQVEAIDLWNTAKDSQGQEFLVEFRKLMELKETKKAYILLKEFNEQWDMKGIAASVKAIEDSIAQSRESSLSKQISTNNVAASAVVKDSIFRKGVYYIDVNGGETPYNIVIYPTKVGCARYNLSSEDYNYKILFSDGEVVQADPNAIVRHRDRPVFKLFSSAKERVKLVVC